MDNITEKLEKIIDKKNIFIKESMKKHTSFRIGGMADFFLVIQNENQLKDILKLAKVNKIPFVIIGNGTNLLICEGGIRGFVIKLDFKDYRLDLRDDETYITCGCGMALTRVAKIAYENSLTGLEAMSGIPGTIGGAIRMNAGAYGSEMKDIVVNSKCMDNLGKIYNLNLENHLFGYRKSAFEENGLIILETTIKLKKGEKNQIKSKMDEFKIARFQNQPLEFPNAGSTFKRIKGDIPTAKLIDECGLKGYSIGDAEVSRKHSGFIVNKGNATSKDVLELIEYVKKKVKEKFDVEIRLEIMVLGEK